MNLFEQYGIKEVADVTLYSIHKKTDGSGDIYYVPALYLDTLKISSTEKAADNVWAEGGLGNSRLICWDYNKTINVTLEDALCTPASLGLCWGGILSADWENADLKIESSVNDNPVERFSRLEKVIFPMKSIKRQTISKYLPHRDCEYTDQDTVLMKSSVVDGVDIRGKGMCRNRSYNWRMAIESSVKSVAIIPDRFFDVKGRHFPINYKKPIAVTTPTYENPTFSVIYHIGQPKPNDMRPPAVIIMEQTNYEKKRHIRVSFNGTYTSAQGKTSEQYHFIAYLEERDEDFIGYNHVYKGTVIRPCGKVFTVYTSGSTDHNLVSKDTGVSNPLEIFYDNYGDVMNRIPLTDGGYLSMENDIVVSYFLNPTEADYLKITVDQNNDYWAELGVDINTQISNDGSLVNTSSNAATSNNSIYWEKAPHIDVMQFKGIEMWNKFDSINSLIYFLITKYEQDILSIKPITNFAEAENDFNEDYETIEADHLEDKKLEGKLHAYVNPLTMKPYDDDYWFSEGETFYIKSLVLSTKKKKIKGKRISVKAGQFPGMYMLVGETYIRERDTGNDERMQLKFPLCKVLSNQTINLEADGEPVTFNLELEVASPENGTLMELTSYETAPKMIESEKGHFTTVDGSTEVLTE